MRWPQISRPAGIPSPITCATPNHTRTRSGYPVQWERAFWPAGPGSHTRERRIAHHHLADGPEQRARDAAFAAENPLSHNDWIYAYDAGQAVRTELSSESRRGRRG